MSNVLFAAAKMHLNTNLGLTQCIVNAFLKMSFLAILLLLYAVVASAQYRQSEKNIDRPRQVLYKGVSGRRIAGKDSLTVCRYVADIARQILIMHRRMI